MTPDDAQLTLEKILGFTIERVEQASAGVEEGKVIGTNPAAGKTAEKGSTVELLISTGPEPVVPVEVPSVLGLQRDEAAKLLEDAGFVVQINGVEAADVEPGTVLDQDPGAGVKADLGSTVTITVAVEPEPPTASGSPDAALATSP
jgi:serine/threonine-protein kinase